LAREPVVLIIGLAGQAPFRRSRLSSNVRAQNVPSHLFTILLVVATALSGCSTDCASPEKELRASFQDRFSALERIRSMSAEDKSVVRIAPTFTHLDTDVSWPRPPEKLGFSEERWNEYRTLFHAVGSRDGLSRIEDSVYVSTKSCGLSISGKEFGYVYRPSQAPTTIKALDSLSHQGKGFIPLRANWYLYVWAT